MRRYAENVAVVVLAALPNFAITFASVALLPVLFPVPGWVAYLIGQVMSVQYSVAFNRTAKTRFGRFYSFAKREEIPGIA